MKFEECEVWFGVEGAIWYASSGQGGQRLLLTLTLYFAYVRLGLVVFQLPGLECRALKVLVLSSYLIPSSELRIQAIVFG